MKSFTDMNNRTWYLYNGTFWTVAFSHYLFACPALENNLPEFDADGTPNAVDVLEANEHEIDFVNRMFNTNFQYTFWGVSSHD